MQQIAATISLRLKCVACFICQALPLLASATQLPAPHTPQPPTPATCLDQPITEAEIEVALQKLHNGRSGALLGYTSELLRYAKLVPTNADPAPGHLLLPCLHMLACCISWHRGQPFLHIFSALPYCSSSSLQCGSAKKTYSLTAHKCWS